MRRAPSAPLSARIYGSVMYLLRTATFHRLYLVYFPYELATASVFEFTWSVCLRQRYVSGTNGVSFTLVPSFSLWSFLSIATPFNFLLMPSLSLDFFEAFGEILLASVVLSRNASGPWHAWWDTNVLGNDVRHEGQQRLM